MSKKTEEINLIFENQTYRIEEIQSFGVVSPKGFWYDQEEAELVSISKGQGELEFPNGEKILLNVGDCFLLQPHKLHRVSYTSSDCQWRCVFMKVE